MRRRLVPKVVARSKELFRRDSTLLTEKIKEVVEGFPSTGINKYLTQTSTPVKDRLSRNESEIKNKVPKYLRIA